MSRRFIISWITLEYPEKTMKDYEDKKIRKWNQVIRKIGTGRYRKNKYTSETTFYLIIHRSDSVGGYEVRQENGRRFIYVQVLSD